LSRVANSKERQWNVGQPILTAVRRALEDIEVKIKGKGDRPGMLMPPDTARSWHEAAVRSRMRS
jgi:hypothetical protein